MNFIEVQNMNVFFKLKKKNRYSNCYNYKHFSLFKKNSFVLNVICFCLTDSRIMHYSGISKRVIGKFAH